MNGFLCSSLWNTFFKQQTARELLQQFVMGEREYWLCPSVQLIKAHQTRGHTKHHTNSSYYLGFMGDRARGEGDGGMLISIHLASVDASRRCCSHCFSNWAERPHATTRAVLINVPTNYAAHI